MSSRTSNQSLKEWSSKAENIHNWDCSQIENSAEEEDVMDRSSCAEKAMGGR